MDEQHSTSRPNTRVQAIVIRDRKILMAKHREAETEYWCLPGGGLESDETLEEGVLRELKEEGNVDGIVLRLTANVIEISGIESFTYLVDIGHQEPSFGQDPEVDPAAPILVDLRWLALNEIPERDRAFLWQAGLMTVPGFIDQVEGWGDAVSCPDCIG
ncbi:NUDIX hydrolase [Candidatus Bipolaricaulota bacterium]|nr:NUDIX hydrolase [Candidatus Bipolaricaulota bacterium]